VVAAMSAPSCHPEMVVAGSLCRPVLQVLVRTEPPAFPWPTLSCAIASLDILVTFRIFNEIVLVGSDKNDQRFDRLQIGTVNLVFNR
jgi:hypothetical protein